MICFLIDWDAQDGQAMSPRADCSSKSAEAPNQPSKGWPCSQTRA